MPLPSFCPMALVLIKAPPNGPSHNTSKLSCAKWHTRHLGQLNSLVLISACVEGRHGMLFTTNCLLLVGEKLLQVFGFVYLCLGQVRVGFAASALVCNRLFWPFETLSLDLLGLQRPIGCILGLRQGYCALGSVFHLCCWALLVYPLYFVRNSTSGHCCPSRHFVQGCTNLRDLP